MAISPDMLQRIRDSVDIGAVVQRRVPLTKLGRDLPGRCPFHVEKTPSFYVVPHKRLFHCFGCGVTGDAIAFLMRLDGSSFPAAVEQLAAELGIELPATDPKRQREAAHRAALAEVNEKACSIFEHTLWDDPAAQPARHHLERRGISSATARAWRLGYAPVPWSGLCDALQHDKIDAALVEELGLGIRRKTSPGLYDRFRGRLIIPVRDAGRTVAFAGRLIEGQGPKYINSPESPLYTKSSVLFGLDQARAAIRDQGVAVLVEGYFDTIALHQAGLQVAVAACGSTLSARQAELLTRIPAKELVLLFDGDAAGARAVRAATAIAIAAGLPARVLAPRPGEDPDELVQRCGAKALGRLLAAAPAAIDVLLDRALEGISDRAPVEVRIRALDGVLDLVRAAPDGLARTLYVQRVADRLQVPRTSVRAALARSHRR